MITEQPDFDLAKLKDHFTVHGDYTKDIILEELQYWRFYPDFLCLISENEEIDGFVLGYRNRNSLWLAQIWRKNDGDWSITREGFERTKAWARERGMTSLTGESTRKEMAALKRRGFMEYSVILRCEL